jgi:hypothetical protein
MSPIATLLFAAYSTQLNSTQHNFITQTGISTAIDLKCHFEKRQKQSTCK